MRRRTIGSAVARIRDIYYDVGGFLARTDSSVESFLLRSLPLFFPLVYVIKYNIPEPVLRTVLIGFSIVIIAINYIY